MSDRLELALAELAAAIRAEVLAELEAERSAPDRLLDVDEARSLLGLGRSTFYSEVLAGRLRTVKVGRRRLVPAAAIAEYIAARQAA